MKKDDFKRDFFEMFMKYVFVDNKRGVGFNLTVLTEKLLEKYEIKEKGSD